MYFPTVDTSTGRLKQFRLVPMQIRRMKLNRASRADAEWLGEVLNRESGQFGVQLEIDGKGDLMVKW